MPPRGVKSAKRKRQYNKIKKSARSRGASTGRAKEIAARTVNKQRRKAGQTKGTKTRGKTGTAGKSSRSRSSSKRSTSSRSRSSSSSRRSTGSGRKKK